MKNNEAITPKGRDLRDHAVWDMWKELLPKDDKEIVCKAAMVYVESEDTLMLIFPHVCQAELGADGFSRVVDAIRSFYDANRQRWMVTITDLNSPGLPPRDAVIPNIVVEIAHPKSMIH